MSMHRLGWWIVLASLVSSGGCMEDFQVRSQIQEVRVLAMVSSLLEVGLDETVSVEPVVYVPEGESVDIERWTFCPINLGADLGYRCLIEACNVELESSEAMGSVTFSPGAQAIECIQKLIEEAAGSESTGAEEGESVGGDEGGEFPEVVQTVLFYDIVTGTGETITSLKEIPLYLESVPAERNQAPVINRVTIDTASVNLAGEAVSAQRLEKIVVGVEVDESSLQPYVDIAGRDRMEEAMVSFYASKGVWEADRRLGANVENTLDFYSEDKDGKQVLLEPPAGLADDDTALTVYAVVRDGRGGQTVAGPFTVELVGN